MKRAKGALVLVLSLVLAFSVMMVGGCSSSSSSPAAAALTSIAVTPATASVPMFKTKQFTATGTYADATTKDLTAMATWSSSAAAVATIDAATGLATAVSAGTATITATSGDISITAVLTVTPVYAVTFYMASEGGGHMGVFPAVIDPSNTTEPISITTGSVTKIQLQGGPTSNSKIVSHDVRLDEATNRVYYSQFLRTATIDETNATGHVGYVDLSKPNTASTGNSVDATIDIDASAAGTIAFALDNIGMVDAGTVPTGAAAGTMKLLYCASGQNADYFFPMSMSFPAYIDAIPKAKITAGNHITSADIKRTYISSIDDAMNGALWTPASGCTGTLTTQDGTQIGPNFGAALGCPPLAFIHGATNKAGTKMYLSTNVMEGLDFTHNTAGVFRTYLLNTSDVISGLVDTTKVTKGPDITGLTKRAAFGGSVAYRASFTPDDKYILQSGADRMLILDGTTLAVVVDTKSGPNADTNFGGGKTDVENHDVTYTPDGKYAILALRYVDAAGQAQISGVQLYDINSKKFVGGVTNTCGLAACHDGTITDTNGKLVKRPTCGIVGKFK